VPVSDPNRLHEIAETMNHGLRNPDAIDLRVYRRPPRQLKNFPIETLVTFSRDNRNQRSLMRLVTGDRPGLLAQVGRAFSECGVRVLNAKIATIGAETDDIFFITNRQDQPLDGEQQIPCLEDAIHRYLDTPS